MSTITDTETVKITGGIALHTVTKYEIKQNIDSHATAVIEGLITDDVGFKELHSALKEVTINITSNQTSDILYSGVVDDFEISRENGIYHAKLYLISHTSLLDKDYNSRSFQDLSMSYEDLVNAVIKDSEIGSFISSVDLSSSIPYPIIQYHETDWQFLKRIASHFGAILFPHFANGEAEFYFGLPESKKTLSFSKDLIESGISDRFWKLGGYDLGLKKSDFYFYNYKSRANLNIGDTGILNGSSYRIVDKKTALVNYSLQYNYTLATEGYAASKMSYNSHFSGLSLLGTVIETNRETLKIHLDIDKEQDTGKAYPYKWTPETGNLMYLMPQVGTRVSLYFYNWCESSGKAVNCIRTNGDNPLMGDVSQRRLLTEHGKQMHLFPESMGFTSTREGTPLTLMFDDTEGIVASSHNKLDIVALDGIMIEAPTVVMTALTGLTATKADIVLTGGGDVPYNILANPVSILNMMNLTEMEGGITIYEGWEFNYFSPFEDAPTKGKFAWGKLILNVLGSIAIVNIVVLPIAALGALTGGTAVGGAIAIWGGGPQAALIGMAAVGIATGLYAGPSGAFNTYKMAWQDFQSGNVRDFGDYASNALYHTASSGSEALGAVSDIAKVADVYTKMWTFLNSPPPSGGGAALAQGATFAGIASSLMMLMVKNPELVAAIAGGGGSTAGATFANPAILGKIAGTLGLITWANHSANAASKGLDWVAAKGKDHTSSAPKSNTVAGGRTASASPDPNDPDDEEKMLGKDGAQTSSTTTGQNGKTERIDVENPNPGQRPGEIHYHEANNTKWRYDVGLGKFVDPKTRTLAPPKIQKLLNEPWVKQAIEKALRLLGE